jgi:hypothetical protein
MNEWDHALKVFLFGFSGVFAGLILLMWAVQLTALFVKIFNHKNKTK